MFNWLKRNQKDSKPKTLGQIGEEMAQEEYKKSGYDVIAANFFNPKGLRLGEVDFIAVNGEKIIFVEVKTRSSRQGKFGSGAEAVDIYKQRKLLKAVKVFLAGYPKYQSFRPQIDVCEVRVDEIDNRLKSVIIIPNAVEDWN
jgi:putative endonuclease